MTSVLLLALSTLPAGFKPKMAWTSLAALSPSNWRKRDGYEAAFLQGFWFKSWQQLWHFTSTSTRVASFSSCHEACWLGNLTRTRGGLLQFAAQMGESARGEEGGANVRWAMGKGGGGWWRVVGIDWAEKWRRMQFHPSAPTRALSEGLNSNNSGAPQDGLIVASTLCMYMAI